MACPPSQGGSTSCLVALVKLVSICLEQVTAEAAGMRGEVQRDLRRIQEGLIPKPQFFPMKMDVSVQKMKVTWS